MRLSHSIAPALVLLLAGCGHSPIDPNAPTDVRGALAGSWSLLQATRADGSLIDSLSGNGIALRLQFDKERLGISGGCNRLSADYSTTAHTLAVGTVASTRMACEPARMQADATLIRMLGQPLDIRWGADRKRVSLHAGDGSRLLLEAAR